MNKNTFVSLAVAALLTAPAVSFAQFSMPSIGGLKSLTGGGASAGDLPGQQDQLVRGYVAANKDVLNANALMADALGLKTAAATSRAQADALTEGATQGNLEASNKEVSVSTDLVAAELKKGPQLDAAAKATFSSGLVSLVSGVAKYTGVGKNVKTMASGLSSASPLQLPKLQSAVYVVSNFPGSAQSATAALSNAIAFAKDAGIQVPTDATATLAALQ